MYKILKSSEYNKLQDKSNKLQELERKYKIIKEQNQHLQNQCFSLEAQLEETKERYDKMLEVENLVYTWNYQEFFNNIPDKILINIVEYLSWIKVEFLKLTTRGTSKVEDIIYRNGLFTWVTKILELFKTSLSVKNQGKFESDNITWKLLQDKDVQEILKMQEWKNV